MDGPADGNMSHGPRKMDDFCLSNDRMFKGCPDQDRPSWTIFAGWFTLYLAYKTSKSPVSDEFKEKALEIVSEYKNVGFLMLVDLPGPGILGRPSVEPYQNSVRGFR